MKILLILVAVGIAAMLFLRKKPARPNGKSAARKPVKAVAKKQAGRVGTTPAPEKPAFRCTSIKAAGNACDAAKEIECKRYLHSEVPSLPLADCDVAKCDCRYTHHDDRRATDEDRRAIAGLSAELYAESGKTERRAEAKGRGRRKEDKRA